MNHHRFLNKLDEKIKKGINQLFLYGDGLEDYFLFDVYMGVRNLRDNLFFYFVKNDFDYFIEINGDNISAYDKNNTRLSLDEAFKEKKVREGFGSNIHSNSFDKLKSQKDVDISSVEESAKSYASFNERDKLLKNLNKYKLFIFIPELEYQAKLYKSEKDVEFIRFIRNLKFSRSSVSVISIKNLEHLKEFDFNLDERSKNTIFIGNPSLEEIKITLIREGLRRGKDIDWFSFDELVQGLHASKRNLIEIIKVLKNKMDNDISFTNFQDILDKNISEVVSFKDVVLKDKDKIIKVVETFLQNKEDSQKGLILYGPPGTGKTYIAKAIANEFNMYFLAPTLADIKGEYVGESSKKVKKIFEEARANSPSILFLDEMDTLFKKRGESDSFVEDMINQFLVEIDGVNSGEDRVFIIGATNRLETIDDAIKSRLSIHIEIDLPDREDRELIIKKQFKKFDFSKFEFKDEILDKTEGLSGRDLFYLCKNVKSMSGDSENIKKIYFDSALKNFENKLIEEFKSKLEGSLKIEEPQITFKDVIGYNDIKYALRDEVEYILMSKEEKERQKEFGITQNRGTLLYGPPGNGKTTFAEALAGSYNFYYIRVVSRDFISSSQESVLKKLEAIFEYSVKLSKISNKNGVVLFFDEIDSLIGKDSLTPIIRGTVLKFLEDKKGIKSDDSKIVLIAATNHFEKLDKASIRDGRFDNKFEVGYPNDNELIEILASFFRLDDKVVFDLDNYKIDEIISFLKEKKAKENNKISIVDLKNLKNRLKRFAFKQNSFIDDKILINENVVNNFFESSYI